MESYQSWLGEGPELAILRMLGLFDRPVDEQTFSILLKSPAIPGLTVSLTDLSQIQEIDFCRTTLAEAISRANELNDMHALAVALFWATVLSHYEGFPNEVERCASDLIELSTRQNFPLWLAGGEVLRGWARSASGSTAEGLSWIERGIADWRATGSMWSVPYFLALKAEALHLANRNAEALATTREADALVERSEERWWCAELHRLRGVFLTATGAQETEIEPSFCQAIRIARQQKSVSLEKRAEATYAEYRRQKASGSGGHESRCLFSKKNVSL
jgi:predicted ATPase